MELLGCIFKDSAYCACEQRPNAFEDLHAVAWLGSPTLNATMRAFALCADL